LSAVLVNFEEQSGHWKITETVYDYLKAGVSPESQLLNKLEPRLKKVEKYLQEQTSVLFKRFPDKIELYASGADLSFAAVKKLASEALSLLPCQTVAPVRFGYHKATIEKSVPGEANSQGHFQEVFPNATTRAVMIGLPMLIF
jgi:hypothetical protein